MKKTVVFDFDGVINSYKSGWLGAKELPDPPVEGIDGVIQDLRLKGFEVCVVSSRCEHPGGMMAILDYLEKHKIVVDNVVLHKPPALAYVDDRAVVFNGKTEGLVDQIVNLKAWWEK